MVSYYLMTYLLRCSFERNWLFYSQRNIYNNVDVLNENVLIISSYSFADKLFTSSLTLILKFKCSSLEILIKCPRLSIKNSKNGKKITYEFAKNMEKN